MAKRVDMPARRSITGRGHTPDNVVKSAGRALQILEFLDDIQRHTTVMEVSEALQLPQSSTSALLRSLVMTGYLNYDAMTRKYITSSRVTLLGNWVDSHFSIEGRVMAMMKELSRRTGDTIVLASQSGLEAKYIHVIQATSPARLHLTLGTVRSIAHSGAGYAMLSTMTDAQAQRLVMRINAEAEPDQPHIPVRELLETIAGVRARGYSFTTDLVTRGGGIMAAPLPRIADQPLLVIGIGGVSDVMRGREAELSGILVDTVARHYAPIAASRGSDESTVDAPGRLSS